jgi:hypothetical protein
MHAWTKLDDTSKPFLLECDEDRHYPAAATGVEHGTTRTFSL